MTTLQKQIKHINNNLFAARMENIIQYMYEDELEKQVAKVFHRMRKGILKNLKEYYSPDIMVNAHMDLILAPIHEYHKKYYDTIMKYKLREHRKGQVQGRRLVKRAKQYAKAYSKNYFGAVKADSTIPMSSIIQKDKLFATSDYSADHMRDKTFLASENTLARVDKDINKIISDGYTDGWGINDVASNIEKRFNQLETWEARRIARTEIHGSHMQGIMQSYEEMGVEYTQWASAHDNRTRDTHSALDGEIIPFGGVYSNGLRYPGDTSGPISEWINCRCGNLPWFCPPGFMVPVGMTNFRESDLIPTHAFQTTEDRIKEYLTSEIVEQPSAIPGMNKYALTPQEERILAELEPNKESLGFIDRQTYKDLADRKELNEMWNKILLEGGDPTDYFAIPGGEGVRYEKLIKKFKNWVPKSDIKIKPIEINRKNLFKNKESFKLTSEEKQVYKILNENSNNLSDEETIYYRQLSNKLELNRYHKKLVENGLDSYDSRKYIELYSKYQREWDLPDISLDVRFTTGNYKTFIRKDYYKNATEFTLTRKEADKLYELEKKRLIFGDDALSKNELKIIEDLQAQQRFAYLHNMNQIDKGLNYEHTVEFKKLYKQLKTKLKLDKSVLEQPLSDYDSKIPLDKNPKNFKIFKGTNDDGLLPNGESLYKYFTKDARKMTIREQEVADRWLGSDYRAFTDFEITAERDIDKFVEHAYKSAKLYEENPVDNIYYKYYYGAASHGGGSWKENLRYLGNSIAHDIPTLDDILNNQLKNGISLWRVQEAHNLESTVVGDIIRFPNFRSTAISKEGALWFSATNRKEMSYIIEIEAPAGTKGAYLAPIKQGTWMGDPDNPHFMESYAREMEFLLKECEVEIVEFEDRTIAGALGEELQHIKLRIVG